MRRLWANARLLVRNRIKQMPGIAPLQWAKLMSCPFCLLNTTRKWIENEHAIAFPDAYPLTNGHMLVIPRKHVSSVYELTADEQSAVWDLVAEVRQRLLTGLTPDAFNIGVNDGLAAGQTIEHAHIHVIPRRK